MTFSLSQTISPRLRQVQMQECSVCKQLIFEQRQHETGQLNIVFGSAEYAVCPCCKQAVSDHKERRYQHRAEQWIRKVLREREQKK